MTKLICLNCGNPFWVYLYRKDTAKFCSKSCGSKFNRNGFKTGRIKRTNGYICIRINKEYVYEHRYIMGQHLGRILSKNESVHHINGIKTDNRIENLILLPKKVHDSFETKKRLKDNPESFFPPRERCGAIITERHRRGQKCKRFKPCPFH